ncbi:MAG: hypothetical protein D6724_06670 [Armatimonadetes bacterium]|nr:MAG: hypothetical protein D6724_06670 [Armatimonadota bacterium]
MIFPFFVLEDEDEDRDVERRKNPYLTGAGLRWLIVIFVVLVSGALAYIKLVWEPARWPLHIKGDLRAIHGALFLYAEQNNDGLPVAYTRTGTGVLTDAQGRPACWASQLSDYISDVDHFTSPAVPKEWGTPIAYRERITNKLSEATLSYGIVSWATLPPTRTYLMEKYQVLVAETISNGKGGSYDPSPLPGGVPDGFLIGYDNSNDQPTSASKFVTRLAFIGETDDPTKKQPVHKGGVLALFPDGRVGRLLPTDVIVSEGTLQNRWR